MERVEGRPAATDESQELWEFSESESWSNHEKEVTGKPVASMNSENLGNPITESMKWLENFHMSSAMVPHMEKVFSRSQGKFTTAVPRTTLDDLDVNTVFFFWRYL